MNKLIFLALASALSVSAVALAQDIPVASGAAVGEITGEVMVVTPEKHMLTIRKPDGDFQVIHVPGGVKRLDEVEIGDTLTISYFEAVAIDLQKGGQESAPAAVTTTEIDRAPGEKPAGTIEETVTITGTVEAVDKVDSTVTVRGPEDVVTVTVEHPEWLEEIVEGDSVTVTYISAGAAKFE